MKLYAKFSHLSANGMQSNVNIKHFYWKAGLLDEGEYVSQFSVQFCILQRITLIDQLTSLFVPLLSHAWLVSTNLSQKR